MRTFAEKEGWYYTVNGYTFGPFDTDAEAKENMDNTREAFEEASRCDRCED